MDVKAIIVGIIILIAAGVGLYLFSKKTKDQKIASVKEWLKWAVVAVEKDLGSKTGQLKLQKVYNLALIQFPWISKIIPFPIFSGWVDEALDWMIENLSEEEKHYIEEK